MNFTPAFGRPKDVLLLAWTNFPVSCPASAACSLVTVPTRGLARRDCWRMPLRNFYIPSWLYLKCLKDLELLECWKMLLFPEAGLSTGGFC